jgi:hypothetical protein
MNTLFEAGIPFLAGPGRALGCCQRSPQLPLLRENYSLLWRVGKSWETSLQHHVFPWLGRLH